MRWNGGLVFWPGIRGWDHSLQPDNPMGEMSSQSPLRSPLRSSSLRLPPPSNPQQPSQTYSPILRSRAARSAGSSPVTASAAQSPSKRPRSATAPAASVSRILLVTTASSSGRIAVKPKTRYRLTGYIKTKDVLVKGTGATLSLEGGFGHAGVHHRQAVLEEGFLRVR